MMAVTDVMMTASTRTPGRERALRRGSEKAAVRRLRAAYEGALPAFDRADALARDPVRFARARKDPRDREVAAFLAAALATGSVAHIGRNVGALLEALGPAGPARGAREVARGARRLPAGLRHRWLGVPELTALVRAVGAALERHGSLEALFAKGDDPSAPDIGTGLARFVSEMRKLAVGEDPESSTSTSTKPRHLASAFASPEGGSACKRPCLFLRWVARPDDGVDLGVWTRVAPERLVAPLDTHVVAVARRLGITRRVSVGWPMALEVTAALRALDPEDPLRFDFGLVYLDQAGRLGARARGPRR
jgi:uncharacterized protein (TIGR02757 family)